MFNSFKDFVIILAALFIIISVILTIMNNFALIAQAVLIILVLYFLSDVISGVIGD